MESRANPLIVLVALHLLNPCGHSSALASECRLSVRATDPRESSARNDKSSSSGLDTSWSRLSESQAFRLSVQPSDGGRASLRHNAIHNWTVRVVEVGKGPVAGAKLEFVGGMPAHDHSFPTVPEVTRELGNGTYLLEGVKFNMAGWWQFVFCVKTGEDEDLVRFNIVVEP